MPWTPLRDRLHQLPLILAGPILRRTDPETVTVWLALRAACEVTLEIYATIGGDGLAVGSLLLEGKATTIAVGQHLHLVAVTATATTLPLVPGQIYVYDLKFRQLPVAGSAVSAMPVSAMQQNEWTLPQALNSAALPQISISYFDHQLPSFALPPDDLNQLRIMHGSCRKIHGGDRDALPIVDDLIQQSCTLANARPHQLFLTGDQIYGDEVADPLLMAITDAGDTLLGWEERLPLDEHLAQKYPVPSNAALLPKHLKPGQRSQVAEDLGGFTAGLYDQPECAKSHLFSLGEYCAAYLFSWSQVLWAELPTATEVGRKSKSAKVWQQERRVITTFAQTLWKVRRVFANLPTYMIFDDHDVSDDWYLNREWCLRVLSKSLGKRSVQNGMLSYALFQGWGNTPQQFESGAGRTLLQATKTWSASQGTDTTAESTIAQCLGLPDCDAEGLPRFRQDGNVLVLDHGESAIEWHYSVRTRCYEVIVLDTRTWRGYPADQPTNAPPMLLSPTAFDRQLRQPMQQTDRLKQQGKSQVIATLVVAPTNLVSLEAIDWVQHWNLKQGKTFHNDVGDAWNINKYAFSKLLNTLFEQRDRIIILSGDIHYGSTVALHHWSHQQAELFSDAEFPGRSLVDQSGQKSSVKEALPGKEEPHVLVQLTASAIKNSEAKTRIVHTKIKSLVAEGSQDWAGWTDAPELLKVRSVLGFRRIKPLPPPSHSPHVQRLHRSSHNSWDIAVRQSQSFPDWRYHIEWIRRQPAQIVFDRSHLPKPGSKNLFKQIVHKLVQLVWNNRWMQEGREVVGLNNIGLVQFESTESPDSQLVLHDLYWYAPWRTDAIAFSRYEASLKLEAPPPPIPVLKSALQVSRMR